MKNTPSTTNTSSLDPSATGDQSAARGAHTSGPWVADSISMETGCVGVSAPDLRISIAHVHNAASIGDLIAGAMKRGGGRCDPKDAHTQWANARLIAAAPDLLDALIELNCVIGLTAIKYPEHVAILQKSVDRANSVIAKAEGR